MPFVAQIGDVVRSGLSFVVTIEWSLKDFFTLSEKVDDFYESPVFPFAGTLWYIRLYRNGESAHSSAGWVSLYLMRADSGPPQTVHCTFCIKGSGGVGNTVAFQHEFSEEGDGWGCDKWWSRTDLRDQYSTLLPDGVLTVTCDLRFYATKVERRSSSLGKSLLSVLESGDDSDIVIRVRGKTFPAHKVILRARSSVFRSMFTHDMVEKQSNVVNIEDGDPETFMDFLVHIYSGSIDHISPKNVFSLYTAADKYDVGDLKVACSKFMGRYICVASFCDVMTLALRHDEKELIDCATKFFCDKSLEIVKTAEWQTFLAGNLTVGNELIIKTLSK